MDYETRGDRYRATCLGYQKKQITNTKHGSLTLKVQVFVPQNGTMQQYG